MITNDFKLLYYNFITNIILSRKAIAMSQNSNTNQTKKFSRTPSQNSVRGHFARSIQQRSSKKSQIIQSKYVNETNRRNQDKNSQENIQVIKNRYYQNEKMVLSEQAKKALGKMQKFDRYMYPYLSDRSLRLPIENQLARLQKIKNSNKQMRIKEYDNELTINALYNHIRLVYQMMRELEGKNQLSVQIKNLENIIFNLKKDKTKLEKQKNLGGIVLNEVNNIQYDQYSNRIIILQAQNDKLKERIRELEENKGQNNYQINRQKQTLATRIKQLQEDNRMYQDQLANLKFRLVGMENQLEKANNLEYERIRLAEDQQLYEDQLRKRRENINELQSQIQILSKVSQEKNLKLIIFEKQIQTINKTLMHWKKGQSWQNQINYLKHDNRFDTIYYLQQLLLKHLDLQNILKKKDEEDLNYINQINTILDKFQKQDWWKERKSISFNGKTQLQILINKMYENIKQMFREMFQQSNKIQQAQLSKNQQAQIVKNCREQCNSIISAMKIIQRYLIKPKQQFWQSSQTLKKQFEQQFSKRNIKQLQNLKIQIEFFLETLMNQVINYQNIKSAQYQRNMQLLQQQKEKIMKQLERLQASQKQKILYIKQVQNSKDTLIMNINKNQLIIQNLQRSIRTNQNKQRQLLGQINKLKQIIQDHITQQKRTLQMLEQEGREKDRYKTQKDHILALLQKNKKNTYSFGVEERNFNQQLKDLERKFYEKQQLQSQFRRQISNLNDTVSHHQQKISSLEKQKYNNKKQIQELKLQIQTKQNDKRAYHIELHSLRNQIAELNDRLLIEKSQHHRKIKLLTSQKQTIEMALDEERKISLKKNYELNFSASNISSNDRDKNILNKQIQSLTIQLNEINNVHQKQRASLKVCIQRLNNELQSMIISSTNEKKAARQQIQRVRNEEYKSNFQKVKRQREEIKQLKQQIDKLADIIEANQGNFNKLVQQNQLLQDSRKDIEDKNNQLLKQLELRDDEISASQEIINKLAPLQHKLKKLQALLGSKGDLDELTERLKNSIQIIGQNQSLNNKIRSLKQQISSLKNNRGSNQNQLNNQIRNLKRQLEKQRNNLERTQIQLNQYKIREISLTESMKSVRQNYSETKIQVFTQKYQKVIFENNQLKSNLMQSTLEKNSLKNQLQRTQEEVKRLRNQLMDSKFALNEQSQKIKLRQLTFNQQVANQRQKYEYLKQKHDKQRESFKSDKNEYQNKIQSILSKIQILKRQLQQKEQLIIKNEKTINELFKNNQQQKSKTKNAQLLQINRQLRQSSQENFQKLQKYSLQRDQLKRQLKNLQQKLRKQNQKRNEMQESFYKDKVNFENQWRKHSIEIERYTKKVSEYQQRNAELMVEKKQLQTLITRNNDELKRVYRQLQNKNSQALYLKETENKYKNRLQQYQLSAKELKNIAILLDGTYNKNDDYTEIEILLKISQEIEKLIETNKKLLVKIRFLQSDSNSYMETSVVSLIYHQIQNTINTIIQYIQQYGLLEQNQILRFRCNGDISESGNRNKFNINLQNFLKSTIDKINFNISQQIFPYQEVLKCLRQLFNDYIQTGNRQSLISIQRSLEMELDI